MSPLAEAIYHVLRCRVPTTGDPRISYVRLQESLPPEFASARWDDSDGSWQLSDAIIEIVQTCRAHNLPCIAGLAVHELNGHLAGPGKGFYPLAYPEAATTEEQMGSWKQEMEIIKQTDYPQRL
jgi:hypothetical protein